MVNSLGSCGGGWGAGRRAGDEVWTLRGPREVRACLNFASRGFEGREAGCDLWGFLFCLALTTNRRAGRRLKSPFFGGCEG